MKIWEQQHPVLASTRSIPPKIQILNTPVHATLSEQTVVLKHSGTVISKQKEKHLKDSTRPIPPHFATTQFKKTFKFLKCLFPSLKRNSIETHSQRDKIIKVYTKVQ
jgi:hypothetical protein